MVAGEASGDLLGGLLLGGLKARWPGLHAAGIGGPRMAMHGFEAWWPHDKLAVSGYVEVLRHYREISGIRSRLTERLLSADGHERPDVFVGIDAPDFNLDLEAKLKAAGIKTVHFISPSIWAWRGKRIEKIRRATDLVLCIFPFEPAIYAKQGIAAAYVGHPLADMLPNTPDREGAREQFRIPPARTAIALLPGSRQSELKHMARLFIDTARLIHRQINNVQFLVPLVSRETRRQFEDELYRADAEHLPLTILFGHAHMAMTAADGVLLASGTAALEGALLKRPMVVTYKMPRVSYWIGQRKVYLPYAALPNILAGRFVVPEIFQDEATPEVLCQALLNLIFDKEVKARQQKAFLAMHEMLRQNASEKLAAALLPMLNATSTVAAPEAALSQAEETGT